MFEQHGQLLGRLGFEDQLAAAGQRRLDGGGIVLVLLVDGLARMSGGSGRVGAAS